MDDTSAGAHMPQQMTIVLGWPWLALLILFVLILASFSIRCRRIAAALQAEIERHAETEQLLISRNNELLQLASTDILTGLLNRRVVMQRAEMELRRARRYSKDLAVLMLDLDHFKQVNDQYGHVAGDKVLVDFAKLCQQTLRDTDVIGRYGGEEFVVILPEMTLQAAILSADRLRIAVSQYRFYLSEGTELNLSCSIGIAMYLPERDDLDKLLLRADKALYQAKHQGRNRCAVLQ